MMLLPYKKEPATGSLIPSISTGGAAMKATMKHAAAVSKHGIIRTPNQPTYSLLFVDVTHSQNSGQPARRPFCLRDRFEVVIRTWLSRAPRVDAKLISCNPSLQDKKTNYYTAYEGLGWEQFYNRRAIRSSPMYGEDYLTFIYYKEMLSGLSTLRKPVTV